MNRVRVRQHVNPLGIKYQTPVNAINWEKIYINTNQPLLLDIGCARGKFLFDMAQLEPECNFLGLEIREPLVEAANKTCSELGLTNLHYIFCNANNSLKPILSSLPKGILQRVTIQFPDPWFKNRHAKRRVAQPELVTELADYLAPGGIVFLQSDVKFVEQEMCERFEENPNFQRQNKEWLVENPLPVATERELFTLEKGEPVYRAVFTRV
ncbi:tRNA (guanine-N(7)-)-methyltransferase [Rivularia sp. PCC 7116]|uniref:tRNA (guanosine(46)-N7)-methyltransferase TrmB n=1 Tax=Rivularia sp. PCC 7116 TaxID=373994 RepID=UPI00029EF1DB|nr:tRNA (guanosine(46)-N7)-methyltransferase TrmB [Rivularia sp. PCC 7116]AFY56652.1 tRNA (guanine-N(7)-)-methyltransferase [Rivularia sp. PCC 7116]